MEPKIYTYKTEKNSYTITLKSIKINNTEAFYAEYSIGDSSKVNSFNDYNGIPYYFSNMEFLKEMLESKLP